MSNQGYVDANEAKQAAAGNETIILDALGIDWGAGKPHIDCPYPDHGGALDWRWDAKKQYSACTCGCGDIFYVIMRMLGKDFNGALLWAMNTLGRTDLIKSPRTKQRKQDAQTLMREAASVNGKQIAREYILSRLHAADWDPAAEPKTRWGGIGDLEYYGAPDGPGRPKMIATSKAALFEIVNQTGATGAHRIYLDDWIKTGGHARKKLCKDPPRGGCVIWGQTGASECYVCEGIETGFALAFAFSDRVNSGKLTIFAAISANGVAAWRPFWPGVQTVTFWADRDEKPDGTGSKAGEIAAVKAAQHIETTCKMTLPGNEGEKIDWLDAYAREGKGAVKLGMVNAVEIEINTANETKWGNGNNMKSENGNVPGTECDWNTTLKNGKPVEKDPINFVIAAASLGFTLSRDEFLQEKFITRDGKTTVYGDTERDLLVCEISEAFKFSPTSAAVSTGEARAMSRNKTDALLDYLTGLKWDGVKRVNRLLTDYFGAKTNTEQEIEPKYVEKAGELFMVAAVRRALKPGCKYDMMLVLEGEQGGGKSLGFAALCPRSTWYTDSLHIGASDKETIEQTGGKWIVEGAEMIQHRWAENEKVKAFLSKQRDKARTAYAREPIEIARRWVMVGTTNEREYLTDQTGNRRFMPVQVGTVNVAEIERDRDQLWAEAVEIEKSGAWNNLWLPPELWGWVSETNKSRLRVTSAGEAADTIIGVLNGVDGNIRFSAADLGAALGNILGEAVKHHGVLAQVFGALRAGGLRDFGRGQARVWHRGPREAPNRKVVKFQILDDGTLGAVVVRTGPGDGDF